MELASLRTSLLSKLRKRRWLWITLGAILLLLVIVLFVLMRMTAFHHVRIDQSNEALGIQPVPAATMPADSSGGVPDASAAPDKLAFPNATAEDIPSGDQIRNIALFGLDRRSTKGSARSDVMMILTIDYAREKIKLTSLMRDLYVPIEGHGHAKLNAAYAYGGAPLAIKTINQNFGTDIRDYVTVDFFTMEKIINAVGGVDINVKPNEVDTLNMYMGDTSRIENKKAPLVEQGGLQTLNGMQAVAYARIRYVGNADFERTERQRTVLQAMVDRVKEEGVASIPELLIKTAPYVETTLTRSDMLSMAYRYFKSDKMTIEKNRYPRDGTWQAATTADGQWILDTDLEQIKQQIQDYIFRDTQDPL
ncbi:LCP family protein [Cohnella lubricantis]|uniref:LCP family protein n=1 Tax=Cohnella lubricantis TaxID=2163172 RepID=A0A841TAQ5_9BACL|nr:LCP family protein [Cohnella lubricantis]MBB6676107.1 LCP family protein [Cohnella lubricantis]MBP2118067.1 LCP family protein required for cell wall assembly [Cohnella lubricantis]